MIPSTYREVRAGRRAELRDRLRLLLEDTLDGRGDVADGHDRGGGVLVRDTLDADAGARDAWGREMWGNVSFARWKYFLGFLGVRCRYARCERGMTLGTTVSDARRCRETSVSFPNPARHAPLCL
jgi:hypothetical protein